MAKLKMSKVLEDADPDLQIQGMYIEEWNNDTRKAEGYCAVGLLSCACDNVEDGNFKENEYTFFHKSYGVSKSMLNKLFDCPECEDSRHMSIISTIIHLNDDHSYTYKNIAKFLRKHKL